MGEISGPLLDRIDRHIEVPAVAYLELRGKETGATSAEMRERVLAPRAVQPARGSFNATVAAGRLRDICPLDAAAEKTLEMVVGRLALSARAHDRILKVSRTIANPGGSKQIQFRLMGQAHRRGGAVPVAGPRVLEVRPAPAAKSTLRTRRRVVFMAIFRPTRP